MRMSQSTESERPTFKIWLTAREIIEEQLPGAPVCESTARLYLKKLREDGSAHLWRKRQGTTKPEGAKGRAPGSGVEIHYTALPLDAVVAYEARHRTVLTASQPDDKRLARLGSSVLATAEGGRLRAFILQCLMADPRGPVVAIRDRCAERFGMSLVVIAQGMPTLVPMPSFRTFQAFVAGLRDAGALDARR